MARNGRRFEASFLPMTMTMTMLDTSAAIHPLSRHRAGRHGFGGDAMQTRTGDMNT